MAREIKYSGMNIEMKGRLTKDPETKLTPSGQTVCNASVAFQGGYVSKENRPNCPAGWKETYNNSGWEYTIFAKITAWSDKADELSVYAKGQAIHMEVKLKGSTPVDGIMNPRVWSSNGGSPRASFEFTVLRIISEAVASDQAGLDDDGDEYVW